MDIEACEGDRQSDNALAPCFAPTLVDHFRQTRRQGLRYYCARKSELGFRMSNTSTP